MQIALSYTLQFALETLGAVDFLKALGQGLSLIIKGDNDFYSQRKELQKRGLPLTRAGLQVLDAHANAHCQISEVHKTGLGSSAAMMTSLVGALLSFFDLCALDSEGGKRITHNLAQFCHCFAQGKVGSGFDVSAAVYGSHLYRRFSPEILKPFLEKAEKGQLTGKDLVALVVDKEWDAQVQPCDIPRGIRLVLGEVDTGSNTPSMVSKVLQWKSKNPQIGAF